jgi:hypothetical protein
VPTRCRAIEADAPAPRRGCYRFTDAFHRQPQLARHSTIAEGFQAYGPPPLLKSMDPLGQIPQAARYPHRRAPIPPFPSHGTQHVRHGKAAEAMALTAIKLFNGSHQPQATQLHAIVIGQRDGSSLPAGDGFHKVEIADHHLVAQLQLLRSRPAGGIGLQQPVVAVVSPAALLMMDWAVALAGGGTLGPMGPMGPLVVAGRAVDRRHGQKP